MGIEVYILFIIAVLAGAFWMWHHQRSLRRRAELMQEAVRNHDFTFRLPTHGLLPGERAMQEALNQLGHTVKKERNQNEVEAWERLTRVLTHEIMNATAPIASISQSMLRRNDVKGTPLEEGIRAISATSSHLNTFVDSYRRYSQLQKPEPREVKLLAVAKDIQQLYPEIEWTISIADELTAWTDQTMLRQVLINLTKNAVEAGAKRMGLEARPGERDAHTCCIYVSNDGQPIAAEARSSIFVPFFTTKRSGSGIGLSLSRRMLMQQGGEMELADRPRSTFHTTFLLTLPSQAG